MALSGWSMRVTASHSGKTISGYSGASAQMPSLHRPTTRDWQPATRDGRQTYHFDHSVITKIDKRTVGLTVADRPVSAAARHSVYAGRDDAVALRPMEIDTGIELSIDAAGHSIYLKRDDVVANAGDGRMTYSNIDTDPVKLAEFWQLVDDNERVPGQDRLTVRHTGHEAFWDAIETDPDFLGLGFSHNDCPDELRQLIAEARSKGTATGEVKSNEDLRRWLYTSIKPWQPAVDERTGKRTDHSKCPGQWHDARAGRVQHRIVIAIPACLTRQGVDRALKAVGAHMESLGVMYELACHAPAYDNDERGIHAHLDYYERPCARLPNGAWDFAQKTALPDCAPRRFGKKGKVKSVYPYRQNKTRTNLSDPKCIERFRHQIADIINAELAVEGHKTRYYGGKAEDLGLPKSQVLHLSCKQQSARVLGISTLGDEENEDIQYGAKRKWFGQMRDDQYAEAKAEYTRHCNLIDLNSDAAFTAVYNAQIARKAAADFEYHAACARDDSERLTSRPEFVVKRLGRYLAAIDAKEARREARTPSSSACG
jgi:hypothetical protein